MTDYERVKAEVEGAILELSDFDYDTTSLRIRLGEVQNRMELDTLQRHVEKITEEVIGL